MSRGLGRLQNALVVTIRLRREPMTFADIRTFILQERGEVGSKLCVSFERSLRRALHSLVRDKLLMIIGRGGPGDPSRYFLHPLLIGMIGPDTAEGRALKEALDRIVGACGDLPAFTI